MFPHPRKRPLNRRRHASDSQKNLSENTQMVLSNIYAKNELASRRQAEQQCRSVRRAFFTCFHGGKETTERHRECDVQRCIAMVSDSSGLVMSAFAAVKERFEKRRTDNNHRGFAHRSRQQFTWRRFWLFGGIVLAQILRVASPADAMGEGREKDFSTAPQRCEQSE